jgi:hypothetical protein
MQRTQHRGTCFITYCVSPDDKPHFVLYIAIGISTVQNEHEKPDCFIFVQVAVKRSWKNGKNVILPVDRYMLTVRWTLVGYRRRCRPAVGNLPFLSKNFTIYR